MKITIKGEFARESEDTARERASMKRNANSSASFSSPSVLKTKNTHTFQVTLGQVTDRLLRGLDSQRAHDFLRLSLGRHRLRGNVRAERDGLLSGKSRHFVMCNLFLYECVFVFGNTFRMCV